MKKLCKSNHNPQTAVIIILKFFNTIAKSESKVPFATVICHVNLALKKDVCKIVYAFKKAEFKRTLSSHMKLCHKPHEEELHEQIHLKKFCLEPRFSTNFQL